jgi:retinol dehydrogenase-12
MKKVLALYLFNKLHFSGGVCKSSKRLVGKTVIITGGNTGIGYETALDLAKRGARIILACRNREKANEAADKIKKLTDNEHIESEYLDLADLSSVRHFAKEVNSKLDRLDILINNAGIMMCPYWKTKDGFEIQFGTNHLGMYQFLS